MNYKIFPIDDATWRIEEYDERNSVYLYLLAGSERALLLDTGFGTLDLPGIVSSLTSLPVEVLCSHGHFDHVGGNPLFDAVWMHEADRALYAAHSDPKLLSQFAPGYCLLPKDNVRFFSGEPELDLGGRRLKVLHTPGHTVGCICLLDIDNRRIFTGDTCCKADVLLNMEFAAPLAVYARSVEKILSYQEQYDITWPSHHAVPVDIDIPRQFAAAAQALLDGKAEGEPFRFVFGTARRYAYRDIAIVYE